MIFDKSNPQLNLVLGEPAWPDLDLEQVDHTTAPWSVTALPGGMKSGAPSVAIRIDLENGRTVVAETSLALFLLAADALKAKYGDPRK